MGVGEGGEGRDSVMGFEGKLHDLTVFIKVSLHNRPNLGQSE